MKSTMSVSTISVIHALVFVFRHMYTRYGLNASIKYITVKNIYIPLTYNVPPSCPGYSS